MSESAKVTSVEAIGTFRVQLCKFCEEVREALCAIDMEARRVLDWLAHDQPRYWRDAVRDAHEELNHAKTDLFRRRLAGINGEMPECTEQKDAIRRAQRRLEEAEDRIEKCRRWCQLIQRAKEEYDGPARQLAALVEGDPPDSVALLGQVLDRLDDYLIVGPPMGLAPAAVNLPPVTNAPAADAVPTSGSLPADTDQPAADPLARGVGG
jgi:hypothetical protein